MAGRPPGPGQPTPQQGQPMSDAQRMAMMKQQQMRQQQMSQGGMPPQGQPRPQQMPQGQQPRQQPPPQQFQQQQQQQQQQQPRPGPSQQMQGQPHSQQPRPQGAPPPQMQNGQGQPRPMQPGQGQGQPMMQGKPRPMQPGQPMQGQPMPGQPRPMQPGQPGQPMQGQPRPMQPGQPMQGQPMQGQPRPMQPGQGQPMQGQPGQPRPMQPGQPMQGQPRPMQPGQPMPMQGQPRPMQPGQPGQPPMQGQPRPMQPGQQMPMQPGQQRPMQPGQQMPMQPGQQRPMQPGQQMPMQPGQQPMRPQAQHFVNPLQQQPGPIPSQQQQQQQQRPPQQSPLIQPLHQQRPAIIQPTQESKEEDDSGGYGDDFDEYQDAEFDDPDELDKMDVGEEKQSPPKHSYMSELGLAMAEENRRSYDGTRSKQQQQQQHEIQNPTLLVQPVRKYAPIAQAAKGARSAQQQIENKEKDQRAAQIMKLITLSEEEFDFFHMDPVNDIELFNRRLASAQIRNVAIQYNEEWVTQETQTEHVDVETVESQFPEYNTTSTKTVDSGSKRLQKFLQQAAQVCESLILENLSSVPLGSKQSAIPTASVSSPSLASLQSISSAVNTIQLPASFGVRPVKDIYFSPVRSQLVLIAYGRIPSTQPHIKTSSNDKPKPGTALQKRIEMDREQLPYYGLANHGVLCLWDLFNPRIPNKIFICDGEPSSCCLLAERGHLAFAGLEEGSIAMWDMREESHQHIIVGRSSSESYILRSASFTTDDLGNDNHQASIKKLEHLIEHKMNTENDKDGTFDIMSLTHSSSSTFLISLDEMGECILWSCVELHDVDWSGSEQDLGLAIGSRVKMVRVAMIQDTGLHLTYDIAFRLDDTNAYLAALGNGVIRSAKRYGDKPSPSQYKQMDSGYDSCQSIHFSIWQSNYFLAGYASGTICLYALDTREPIAAWYHICQDGVIQVRWSPFRPSIFFALDGKGTIHMWDLLKTDQKPVIQAALATQHGKQHISRFALSCSTQTGFSQSLLAFPFGAMGAVDVHTLKRELSDCDPPEKEQLSTLMQHLH